MELPKPRPLSIWQNLFVFGLARFISRTLLTLFGRAYNKGSRNFPRKGGILILPNHCSDVDPLLVQLSCPRNVIFMAKSDLFDIKWLAPLMRAGSTFPVKRGEPDRAALRRTADYLKLDQAVCVFPEGQISEDGLVQEIKPGVALIIRMAQVPVICLGMVNTQGVMPYGKFFPRFSRQRVHSLWGEPRTFTKEDSTEEIVRWISEELRGLAGQDSGSAHNG